MVSDSRPSGRSEEPAETAGDTEAEGRDGGTSGVQKTLPGKPAPEKVPWSKRLARAGILAFVTLGLAEITACVGGRMLAARGMFYQPASSADLAEYMKTRDPVLGWPSPVQPKGDVDASGSRIVPAFPDPATPACVSLYGDSFTYGEDVDAEHAWGNVLSKNLGCRVANYGVGGYGTDQALLRFRQKKEDAAKTVVLGILTENVLRNVNSYRELLAPGQPLSFKPRFLVGPDGELQLVPILSPKQEELAKVLESPEKYFEHDYFIPGGPSGVVKLGFPYLGALLSLRTNYKMRAAQRGEPSHAAFYRPDHDSRGLAVTSAIARTFVKEAKDRGAWGGVVIIPLPADLEYLKKQGTAAHAPLVAELQKAGVPYVDTSEKFLATLSGKDPCTLYVKCRGGHFNDEGYRLLAEYVQGWLRDQKQPQAKSATGQ